MSCKYKSGNTVETQSEDGMSLLKLKKKKMFSVEDVKEPTQI